MKPNIYISGDYAGFETPKIKAYYGYEEIDPRSEEWCMVIYQKRTNGMKEVFRKTNSELLDVACGDSPEAMLLAGLALYLSK